MSLSSPGVGSGLDVKTLVDALVKAEITPAQTRHDRQLTDVSTELSAIGQLKSSLSNLQSSLTKLSDLSQFYNMKYSMSDQDYFSTNITPQATKGSYQIEVQKMAQQQSLASNYLTNTGSGTLTINFGTYNNDKTVFTPNATATPLSVTIAPGSDSLIAVRDAINNAGTSVTASIVQDNLGSRLTLTSSKTGENYAMKISGGITALNYDPTTGVNALTETTGAQNSTVKINGLVLNQSSNQLQDAISGVTLNLKKAEIGKIITLTVDDNKDQLTSLMNDFIKQYNDSMTFLTNLTGYNSGTKQAGVFQGDPQFRNLKLNINRWATTPITNGSSPIKSLADLGITTNKQGLLELNQDKYKKALENNYKDIGSLFAKTATATDPNIRIKSVNTKVKAGSYDVALTEFTPGVSMSGTIGSLPANSADGVTLKGTGELNGLSVNILSGSTGARGQVVVTDGIAVLMNSFLDSYMSSKGDLNIRAEQLNNQVKQLGKVQDGIDTRSNSIQTRYLKQFTALDELLSRLQNTSGFLTQQLANLPQIKIK
ncbi:flagellar filament capping protein FliD [Legionella quateirensis]|uniref:Flagellar hook-associated protein 2 n=1 Tax=Legionella quateirensis TaxID=45072 RepID=A0A378KX60_9GAMM|nr:flagellar filament capping protein FliD [Legionella quateirensis]KTD43218.1 flagellar hook associated protein 2 FliD [Legionella quateirensis]STY18097.1 flagellar hook-associated protein 2 [Legionella quateirensis]